MKVYWNTLPGNLTQAEMLPNRIKAGFKVSCCLYYILKTWQRKFFGLGPHERNQGKWRVVEENRWTWTSYTIGVMLWLPKIPAWMLWKLSSALYFFFSLATGVTHEKKWGKKGLYTKVSRPHLSSPESQADLGTMFQAELKTFNSQKVLLTSSKRQFSSSKKGSSARFRKKGQKTSCTSISSWKTTCQWVKWTRIRHIWIEFPSKYSWGPSLRGRVEEG